MTEGDMAAENLPEIEVRLSDLTAGECVRGMSATMKGDTNKDFGISEDDVNQRHEGHHDRESFGETSCPVGDSTCASEDDEIVINVQQENDTTEEGDDEEEDDEEEEDPEMTPEEMKMMHEAVKTGDLDTLDDLLDLPGADINMEWFSENLLMTALRSGQSNMAMFLIDNGIDYNYQTTHMDKDETSGVIEWYTVDCRQVAYEAECWDIVEIIDEKNGELWPHSARKWRHIRYKKTPEMKAKEREEQEEREKLRLSVERLTGSDVRQEEGKRTLCRSERLEYSDDSSLDLTEDENQERVEYDNLNHGGYNALQYTGDKGDRQTSANTGDNNMRHTVDNSVQDTVNIGVQHVVAVQNTTDIDVRHAGDDEDQHANDSDARLAGDNSVEQSCDNKRRHIRVDETDYKGDNKLTDGGDNAAAYVGDRNKKPTGDRDNGATLHKGTGGSGQERADALKTNNDDSYKTALSANEREMGTAKFKSSASAINKATSSHDDISSGYSTLSSPGSQSEFANVRGFKRTTPHFSTTKSYLSRKTANLWLLSGENKSNLPPIRTVSGTGSFYREHKLWSADSGSRRPNSECRQRQCSPEIVTYRPWSEHGQKGVHQIDSTRQPEYKNLVHLHGHKECRKMKGVKSSGEYLTPERFLMRRTHTALLIYSSAGKFTSQNLGKSTFVLDLPIDRVYVKSPTHRPLTGMTKHDIGLWGKSPLMNTTSLIGQRIVAGHSEHSSIRLARTKKYSPAGHLKYTTTKHSV